MFSTTLRYTILFVVFFASQLAVSAQCPEKSCGDCPSSKASAVNSTAPANASAPKASDDDEFLPFDESAELTKDTVPTESTTTTSATPEGSAITDSFLFVPIIGLLASIIAGVFVRFSQMRHTRVVFLLGSMAFFGFYSGACPCPISSLSHTLLFAFTGDGNWQALVWFVGLIPITYVFGQTWCGWVCHLGAMQEFLYKRNRFRSLRSPKAQAIMKYTRIALFLVLVVQLVSTQSYLFDRIDPFRIVYNMGLGASTTTWILTALVLLISLFVYRPFCRAACPIGLVLGFVKYLPYSSRISSSSNCTTCSSASKSCNYQAINKTPTGTLIRHTDCIACGDCLNECPSSGIKFSCTRTYNQAICRK